MRLAHLVLGLVLATALLARASAGGGAAYTELCVPLRPSADTTISRLWSDLNYGKEEVLYVSRYESAPSERSKALLRFDLSRVPPRVEVSRAVLTLFIEWLWASTSAPVTLSLLSLGEAWDEACATWSMRTCEEPWSTPEDPGAWGADEVGRRTWSASDEGSLGLWWRVNVTETVRAWVSGERENHGFMIELTELPSGVDAEVMVASREYFDEARRPVLKVCYLAGFSVTVEPESLEVVQGSVAVATISVTPRGMGADDTVELELEGSPLGVSYHFSERRLHPPSESRLLIYVSRNAEPGNYTLRLKAVWNPPGAKPAVWVGTLRLRVLPYRGLSVLLSRESVEVTPGGAAEVLVRVEEATAPVNLSVAAPEGLAVSLTPSVVTPGSSASLEIAVGEHVPPGTYVVKVHAKGAGAEGVAILLVHVRSGLSVSLRPAKISLSQGEEGTIRVLVTSLRETPVALKVMRVPPGVLCTLSSEEVSPRGESLLTVKVGGEVPPGVYTLVIRAEQDSMAVETILTLVVKPPRLLLEAEPASLSVYQGEKARVAIRAHVEGRPLPVSLSVAETPPGLSCVLEPPVVEPGGVALLRVEASRNASPGTYELVVRGVGDGVSAEARIVLTVKKTAFSLSVERSEVTLEGGSEAAVDVVLTPLGPFNETVTLRVEGAPEGVIVAVEPEQATPPATVALRIRSSKEAAPGTYQLLVRAATAGGLEETAPLTLRVVRAFDFEVSTYPQSVRVGVGESVEVTVYVTLLGGKAKAVELSVEGLPPGSSYTLTPEVLSPPDEARLRITVGSRAGRYNLTVVARGGGVERRASVTLEVVERRCVIATATYGSELSEEVETLRAFRDKVVLSSYSGRRFYALFNVIYYSWSPYVASAISKDEALRAIARAALYPLIASLSVAARTAPLFSPLGDEAVVYAAGSVAALLLGAVYLTPALLVLRKLGLLHTDQVTVKRLLRCSGLTLVLCLASSALRLDWALSALTMAYVCLLALLSSYLLVYVLVPHWPSRRARFY